MSNTFTVRIAAGAGPAFRPWKRRRYKTIREYAIDLLLRVDRIEDGREVGFDYDFIRNAILHKFPFVTYGGPYQGHPTKTTIDTLWELARNMNHAGVRLPVRPRRKMQRRVP